MKIRRREFLTGAVSAAFLTRAVGGGEDGAARRPQLQLEEERANAADLPRTNGREIPVLYLELCGKYIGEGDAAEVSHLTSRRIVSVDLEDEDDSGEINVFVDERGELCYGLGNDEDGYWKIVRVFEIQEPAHELHEGRFPVAYELTREQFADLMSAGEARWA